MNPIFIGALILSIIAKYFNYDMYAYIVLVMFSMLYPVFYVVPKDRERGYAMLFLSLAMVVFVYLFEYFRFIEVKTYDIAFLVLAMYLLGIISGRYYEEIIFLLVASGIIIFSMIVFPNYTLQDIALQRGFDVGEYSNLGLDDKIAMFKDILTANYNLTAGYSTSKNNAKKDVLKGVEKRTYDIVDVSLSPPSLTGPGGYEEPIAVSVFNKANKEIKRIYYGFDVGIKGRASGIKVDSYDGECDNDFNCYVSKDLLTFNDYDVNTFSITTPSCKFNDNAVFYTRYLILGGAEKTIFVSQQEYGETISSDGPLTIKIETTPNIIPPKTEEDIQFLLNIYTALNSDVFNDYRAYFKYLVLSVPKEVDLQRDSKFCPYVDYNSEGEYKKYVFELREDLSCYNKDVVGVIKCNAVVYSEDTLSFINGYKTFKVYVPYLFYGNKHYRIDKEGEEQCENRIDETFSLDNIKRTRSKEYLVSLEGTYQGDVETLIDEVYSFCREQFYGTPYDASCAYIKIRNFRGDATISTTNKESKESKEDAVDVENILKSLEVRASIGGEIEKKIINNYKEGDLIIKAKYRFKCNKAVIEITLE